MPVVDLDPIAIGRPQGAPEDAFVTPGERDMDDTPRPSFLSTLESTFRTENTAVAYLNSNMMHTADIPDGIKVWDELKGTKYEPHFEAFADVRNRAQFDAVRKDIDREKADREIIAAAPWWMTVPSALLANVIDPTIFIPGGAFIKGVKGGFSIARTGASLAVGALAQSAAQEIVLQQTNPLRTAEESAINLGASVILGGLLGSGGAALLGREWGASLKAIERGLADMPSPELASTPQGAFPTSVGAAAVSVPTLDASEIAGRAAGVAVAATRRLNPGLRNATLESPVARNVGQNLFEMSQYIRGNEEGLASPIAVETLRKEWNGGLMSAIEDTKAAYREYRRSGGDMSRTEFHEAVGRAMRRGDQDAIPEVARVAQKWRRDVFDPLKEAAIEAKLLPADVAVETATSYFSRLWNRKRMIAEEGRFKEVVQDYYNKVIGRAYEEDLQKISARFTRLEQEKADLTITPEKRLATLHELQEFAREHEAQWPSLSEAADRLSEIRSEIRTARKNGDEAAVTLLKQETDAIHKGFPEGALKAFLGKRTELGRRIRNVDLGTVGLQQRSEHVLGQLADLEEANYRAMDRLVKKGQKLERDLDRLDADALDQRISDLAESYGKIAKKAEASAERAHREIENINKRAAAKEVKNIEKGAEISAESDRLIKERVTKEAERQQKLSDRMDEIAVRLETAKNFDHDGLMTEIKSAIDRAIREISAQSMARGERATRLGERMAQLDPERVKQRIVTIDRMKAEAERSFYERWEVKRLGEGVDLSSAARPNFAEAARAIADHAFDTLTGKAGEGPRPELMTIKSRGPMKDRALNIPDELVERWLEDDIDLVGRRYSRVMSSDVELARKFGSADMADALAKVREDYAKLRQGVSDERRLTALDKEEKAAIRDIEGVRDIIRGTYAQSAWERDFGAIVRSANAVQYILKMGQVVLSSLTEPLRVVAAKGMLPFMRDAFGSLGNINALKLSVEEARLAGNINDKILAARLSTVADLTDFYGSRGPVEKFLDNMTNVASSWNGIRLWTDGVKMLASTMIQNKILREVANFAEAKAADKRYLAFLGIDESMAGRIAKQFAEHGSDEGGVHVAGTANWTDEVARRAYRAALNKDLDSMVVTRGAADLPLFGNTPLGKLIFQFNSFNLASHQRVLLRGLQEGPARFLSGVVALSSMGMLQTYLTALATNSVSKLPDPQANPGWWIAEGLDKSGIFQIPMQIANGVEKLTGINPIKAPIKARDEGQAISQKNRNRNELGLFGPSAGTLQDLGSVAGIVKNVVAGEPVTKAQKNAAERLMPFNSYFGIRQMMRYIINPPNE